MSFDSLAPHYRWMEFVLAGDKLQRCRTAYLQHLASPDEILLAGEGHGRCLVACLRSFPSARITCVDSSEKMLRVARRAVDRHALRPDHIRFVHVNLLEESALPAGSYDLIVTHFFLDCFSPPMLEKIIVRLSGLASPRADWLLADFQRAADGWRRWRSLLILSCMYAFFRFATRLPARHLVDPAPLLGREGFTLHHRREADWALLHADWWRRRA